MDGSDNLASAVLKGPIKIPGRVEYRVEGRILRTTAVGPFQNELVAAIPQSVGDLIAKLALQGKWGQIIVFQVSAACTDAALQEFAHYLRLRYQNPPTNPVTALVFRPDLDDGAHMAPRYLQCYQDAGIHSAVFGDYSSAVQWVQANISQTSELMQWKEDYRIGDPAIDEQHQELFKRAATIIAAISPQGQALGVIRLYQYTRTHFSHEEELMQRIGYPDYEAHCRMHQKLLARLDEISVQVSAGNFIKAELEAFISRWLLDHIVLEDTKLATFVKDH
jgi:hemerythrin